jgi:hypothetical protein
VTTSGFDWPGGRTRMILGARQARHCAGWTRLRLSGRSPSPRSVTGGGGALTRLSRACGGRGRSPSSSTRSAGLPRRSGSTAFCPGRRCRGRVASRCPSDGADPRSMTTMFSQSPSRCGRCGGDLGSIRRCTRCCSRCR